MVKTYGEMIMDSMNTDTFVTILADMQGDEKPKCKHMDYYKKNKDSVLDAYDFFMGLPWFGVSGRYELNLVMIELNRKARE